MNTPPDSLSREMRRTLFEERAHAFVMVVCLEQLLQCCAHPQSERRPVRVDTSAEPFFDRLNRLGRVVGDSPSQSASLGEKILMGNDPQSEAYAHGFIRVDHVPSHEKLGRLFSS